MSNLEYPQSTGTQTGLVREERERGLKEERGQSPCVIKVEVEKYWGMGPYAVGNRRMERGESGKRVDQNEGHMKKPYRNPLLCNLIKNSGVLHGEQQS